MQNATPTNADWSSTELGFQPGPGRSWGAIAVAVALAFVAGAGIMLYLSSGEPAQTVSAPLIEAEKGPTRIRPEALPSSIAAAIPERLTGLDAGGIPPRLELPVQGIPPEPAVAPPAEAQTVAELPPQTANPAGNAAPVTPPAAVSGAAVNDNIRPAAAPMGAFRLQLGTLRSAEAVARERTRLTRRYGAQLASLEPLQVERLNQGARGAFYRIVSAPINDISAARNLCADLTARQAPCLVINSRPAAAKSAPRKPEMAPVAPRAPNATTAPGLVSEAGPQPEIRAQLASLRSFAGATRELSRLSRLYGDVLERVDLTVSRVDLGERGVFYRILTGPFPSRQAAGDLCHQLEGNQAGCIILQPRIRAA